MDEAKHNEIYQWPQKADHDLLSAERLHATAFRYPGDVLEPEPADTEKSIELAGRIDFHINFLNKRITNIGR